MRKLAECFELLASPMAAANTLRGQKQRWLVCCCVAAIWSAIAASALLVATVTRARGQEVYQFGATWCGPCQIVSPVVERLRASGLAIRHVDIDQEKAFAVSHGLRPGVDRIPLFVAFDKNGREVARREGALSESEIVGMVDKAKAEQIETATAPASRCRVLTPGGSAGSGTLISECNDYAIVLTCWHIVKDAPNNAGVCVFPNGARYAGKLLDKDEGNDLAALAIMPTGLQPVKISDAQPSGELIAAGFGPNGVYASFRGPVVGWQIKEGATSPDARMRAATRPGDSGGPVVDLQCNLIGVVWGNDGGECYFVCGQPFRDFVRRVIGREQSKRGPPAVNVTPVAPPAAEQPATCDPKKFQEIESRLKALEGGKQDKGDYATRGDIPTIPEIPKAPDLSGYATKGDIQETHSVLDKIVGAIGPAIDAKLAKIPVPQAAAVATHVLGVPTWLAAPVALIGGPAGVALSLVAIAGYRRLAKRPASYVTVEHNAAAGGRRSDCFQYGDQPVAGRIVPRDADGNPI